MRLKFTMCAGKRCCPVLTEREDGTFEITDDYNGKVIIEKEQLKLLKEYLNNNLE